MPKVEMLSVWYRDTEGQLVCDWVKAVEAQVPETPAALEPDREAAEVDVAA